MPEWLQQAFFSESVISTRDMALRLVVALVLGCVVAGIYRATHGRLGWQSSALMPTMVLLSVLIAMVTLVIKDNVARAFSLVGALSIVRFRTMVEDARDTAFVIFAVAVGMAAGSGALLVALVGIPIAAAAAFLFRPRVRPAGEAGVDYSLTLRLSGTTADTRLDTLLAQHLESCRLLAVVTARQGLAFERSYTVRLRPPATPADLVAALNGVEGMQSVELRTA